MQDSTLKRGLVRLGWLTLAAVISTLAVWLTDNYATWSFYPIVYILLTTVRDIVNKNLPNLPKGE